MSASATTQERASPPADQSSVAILSKGFVVGTEGDLVVVSRRTLFDTVPLYHFVRDDTVGRYLAMVDLVRHHDLYAVEVADAFGVHRVTLQKMLKRFEAHGAGGLMPGKGRRMPTNINDAFTRRLLELENQGVRDRDAAHPLRAAPCRASPPLP